MLRSFLAFSLLAAALSAPPNQDAPSAAPPLDTTAIDAFWGIFDTLQKGTEPTPAQWQELFSTDGYMTYAATPRRQGLFREAWMVALAPNHDAQRAALKAREPMLAPYIDHFSTVPARANELRTLQASLAASDIQQQARTRALAYLPAEARQDTNWPRVVPVIAEPDGKAVGDMIVIDLLLAADLGSFATDFLAHEMHHVYGRRLRTWTPRVGTDRPEWPLLHAVDQLALEGIADLIDKPTLLSRGGPLAERYKAALDQSAATIRSTDALLTAIGSDPSRMKEDASALWKGLPFAGHTTGFYMAQAIRDGLGTQALEECVRDPVALFRVYNNAARKLNAQGQDKPLFSDASLAVIARLAQDSGTHVP